MRHLLFLGVFRMRHPCLGGCSADRLPHYMYGTSATVVRKKHFLADACLFVVIFGRRGTGIGGGEGFPKGFGKGLTKGLRRTFRARGRCKLAQPRTFPDRPGPFGKGSERPANPTRKAFEGARGEISPTCARGRGAVTSRRHESLAASARAVARQVSRRRAARCGITRAWSSVRVPCAHQQEVP